MKNQLSCLFLFLFLSSFYLASSQGDENDVGPASHIGGDLSSSAFNEEYGFLAQGGYLTILDITSDPFNQLGYIYIEDKPTEMAIQDQFLFMAAGGLKVYDISDPMNPSPIGDWELDTGAELKFYIDGNTVFIAGGDEGLVLIDISDLFNPIEIGRYQTGNTISEVFVSGEFAYILDLTYNKLRIIDISDMTNPVETGEINVNGPTSLFVKDNYAYVTVDSYPSIGMRIFDVSDQNNPFEVAYIETKTVVNVTTHYDSPHKIIVDEKMAYVACATESSVYVFDVSDPASPLEYSRIVFHPIYEGFPCAFELMEDNLYLSFKWSAENLRIIDITDPANLTYSTPYQSPSDVLWVTGDTNHLYIADLSKLWVYNMADVFNPVLLAQYPQWGFMTRTFLDENILFGARRDSVFLINVSDPGQATFISVYKISKNWPSELFVANEYLYVLIDGNPGTVEIVDVSDPYNPVLSGTFDLSGIGHGLFLDLESNLLSAGYYNNPAEFGFDLYNISDPPNPVFLSATQATSIPMEIEIYDNYLFYAGNTDVANLDQWHIESYDITDPGTPVLMDHFIRNGEIWDLDINGDVIFAAVPGNTFFMLPLSFPLGIIQECPSPTTRQGTVTGPSMASYTGYAAGTDGYGNSSPTGKKDISGRDGTPIQWITFKKPTPCCVKTAVRPEIAGESYEPYQCSSIPGCTLGNCGSGVEVKATPGPEWVFTKWSGAAGGVSPVTNASITGKTGCPGCPDNIAYANFTPWLKNSGGGSLWDCPFEAEDEVTAMVFNLEASKADSWIINTIDVKISGDEELSQYIKKVKLKWTGEEEKDHSGNGTISFNTSGLSLQPGKAQEFTLYITFKAMTDLKCPGEPKEITIEVESSGVDANAVAFAPGMVIGASSGNFSVACVRNIVKNTNYEKIKDAVEDASDQQEIWVCPGDYEENVAVDKEKLKIYAPDGPTKTYVYAKENDKPCFQLKANGITIEGFAGRDATNSYGIYVYGSTIEESKLINNRLGKNKHGIFLQDAKKTTITNCSSFDNGESGLHVINSTETTITGSSFYENKHNGLYFENCSESNQAYTKMNSSSARENDLNGIYLKNCKYPVFENNIAFNKNDSSGVYIEKCEHIVIKNNPFLDENKNGVKIIDSKKCIIDNNGVKENTEKGIVVSDCNISTASDANHITSNVIVGNRLSGKQKHGIYVNNSQFTNMGFDGGVNEIRSHKLNGITIMGGAKNRMEGDSIFWNDGHGIYIENSCNNIISGKVKVGPENGTGIKLFNCYCSANQSNEVLNARIMQNNTNGIYLENTNGNWIGTEGNGNTIADNKDNGIELIHCLSTDYDINVFTDNKIYENKNYGIKLSESDKNKFVKNTIWSNKSDGILIRRESFGNELNENKITGNNIQEYGIIIQNSDGTLMDKNTVETHKESGIWISDTDEGAYLINNILEKNKIGVHCESSSKITIGKHDQENGPNKFIDNASSGIYIEKCDGKNTMLIANNEIKTHKIALLIEESKDMTISNNTFTEKNETAIKIRKCDTKLDKAIKIENNTIFDCLAHGILLDNTQGVIIGGELISQSNQIKNNKGNGIMLQDCKPPYGISGYINRILKNTVYEKNNNGIYLKNCQFNELKENNIHDNKKDGIHLLNSLWNSIESNSVRENGANGIVLKQSEQNKIGGNELLRNEESGLYLTKANFNEIPLFGKDQNLMNENEDHGIRIDDCVGNKLRANEIKRNKKHGIVINSGEKNLIYGPMEIMDNTKDGIQFSKTSYNRIWNRLKFIGKKPEYAIQIKSNGSQGLHLKNSDHNSFTCVKIWKHTTGLLLENSKSNHFNMDVRILLNWLGGHGICSYSSSYGLCTYSHNTVTTLVDGCSVVPLSYDGCHFLDSEENAFTLSTGGKPTFRQCNFVGVGDWAIENQSDTVMIDARHNWWGHESGPGGMGPGNGAKVSDKVIYEPWLTEPVSLQATILRDTIYLSELEPDSIYYQMQNVLFPSDSVRVSIRDSLNWEGLVDNYSVALTDTIGFDSLLYFTFNPGIHSGDINKVVLESVSLVYPDQSARDSVYLMMYNPQVERIFLYPDSLELTLGETWQFRPIVYDQYDKEMGAELIWWSNAPGLDIDGLFTASETGIWDVWVSDTGHVDTAHVQIFVSEYPELFEISLDPPTAELNPGDSLQFEADGWDQFGEPFYFSPIWEADGGSIDSFGLYLANDPGLNLVTAYNTDSSVWTSAEVLVILVNTDAVSHATEAIVLHPNYPNPFSSQTTIPFDLGKDGNVKFTFYDAAGNKQYSISDRYYPAGSYKILVNMAAFKSGIYFYEAEMDGKKLSRKMVKN